MSDRNSWVKNYADVDFNVPFMADNDARQSPDPSPAASTSTSSTPSIPTPPIPSAIVFPRSFPSSPLNPSAPSAPSFPRSNSRSNSTARISRMPSEEDRTLSNRTSQNLNSSMSRGSMILYRRADPRAPSSFPMADDILLPPNPPHLNRSSMYSTSGDSTFSRSSDSKYPTTSRSFASERGLVAYIYDPDLDDQGPPDEEDRMHDPQQRYHHDNAKGKFEISSRGFLNIAMLVAMIVAILMLFVGYPIFAFLRDNGRSQLITMNTRINATGQASFSDFQPGDNSIIGSFSDYIDRSTPQNAFSFVGTNDLTYDLAFSDEFNYTGQTYRHRENLFWEARNTGLSSPDQITTKDGQLEFRIDPLTTTASNGQYVSGILDSTVPFCVGRGFAVVGMKALDGTAARIFWAGGAWSYTNAAAENHVPAGPSLNMDVSLSLNIGVIASKIPKGTTVEQPPTSVTVDYIRYYERRVGPNDTRDACDVQRAVSKDVTLDLLNITQ